MQAWGQEDAAVGLAHPFAGLLCHLRLLPLRHSCPSAREQGTFRVPAGDGCRFADGKRDTPSTTNRQGLVSGRHDGSLYRAVLCILVDVGQDGIGGVLFVRLRVYIAATGYCHFAAVFRAAFGNQQIIPAVFLVNMRSFRVPSARAVPDAFGLVELFAGFGVDFAQIDTYARIADEVTLAVFKIEGRVYTALLEPYGF